jgi:tetratricopeptide (TPR) repeat protein
MEDLDELLQDLKAAKGDIFAQAAVTAEGLIGACDPSGSIVLREAFNAAATLRWFDEEFLALVLGLQHAEIRPVIGELRALPFVEPWGGGTERWNIHEATRLGWRRRMASREQPTFRNLSLRAANIFSDHSTPEGRIEWAYHLAFGDPAEGARALAYMREDWSADVEGEDRHRLAAAFCIPKEREPLGNPAKQWALLIVATDALDRGVTLGIRALIEEATMLIASAEPRDYYALAAAHIEEGYLDLKEGNIVPAQKLFQEALQIYEGQVRNCGHERVPRKHVANSHDRLGDVQMLLGNLRKAMAHYQLAVDMKDRISQDFPRLASCRTDLACSLDRLAESCRAQGRLESAESFLQRARVIYEQILSARPHSELVLVHARLGDLFKERGKYVAALDEYRISLEIATDLANNDPSHPNRQWWKATLYERIGALYQIEFRLDEAYSAFVTCRLYVSALATRDRGNATWQREAALATARIGDVLKTQNRLDEAEAEYIEYKRMCSELAGRDPSNAVWRRDIALAHARMADLLLSKGQHEEAEAEVEAYVAIMKELSEREPTSGDFLRELGRAYCRLGDVLRDKDDLVGAEEAFEASQSIAHALIERSPESASWQWDYLNSLHRVGHVKRKLFGPTEQAYRAYRNSIGVALHLTSIDGDVPRWQEGLAKSYFETGDLEIAKGNPEAALPLLEKAVATYKVAIALASGFAKKSWKDSYDRAAMRLTDCRSRIAARI